MADCEVPWYPRSFNPDEDVKVVHLGVDPLWERYPIRTFPAQLAIPGSTRAALELLDAALQSARVPESVAQRRRAAIKDFNVAQAAKRAAALERARTEKPIRYAYAGDCLRAALPKRAIVVTELGVSTDYLQLEEPGSLLGVSIGGGLGFGLGASLGAKLAAPDRTVISTIGDGSYMFGNPTPFHFVARAANLPVLTISCNNCRWQAVDSATRVVYPQGLPPPRHPRCRSSSSSRRPSSRRSPRRPTLDAPRGRSRRTCRARSTRARSGGGRRQALLDVRMEHGIR